MQHRQRCREIGDREIRAGQPQQRRQQQTKRDADEATDEHRQYRGRLEVHHHDRKAVGAGTEEADITERQIAGESVDDVDALGEHQEDHEIEQQQMVLVDAGQHRQQDDQRRDDEQRDA